MLSRLDEIRGQNAGPSHVKIAVNGGDDPLAAFDDIRLGIETIDASSDKIDSLRSQLAHAVRDEDQRAIMTDLDGVMLQVKRAARQIKKSLDGAARDNDQLLSEQPGSTTGQMCANLLMTQAQAFQRSMQRYQDESQRFNDDLKGKIVRQARIVNANVTDAEIEDVLQGGDPSSLLQDQTMMSEASIHAMEEIEERHRSMKQIEQGVRDIQELFQDMAVLVETQGETLNVIERNVADTKQFATSGEEKLTKAEIYQRRARRQQMMIFLILLILVTIMILVFWRPW